MSAASELEALAVRQWGEPTVRTRREWRWGSKGSLSLVISGSKRGLWHDHESGQGGRLDRPEASVRTVRSREVIRTRDDARRIERARRLWEASEPLPATLGERYLIETRGIECPPAGWPNAVRYHRDGRALILAATLADGTLQAVHLVRLTPDAQNARRQDGSKSKIKLTFGTLSSAMVRLPGSADGPLVAEGPETGLALWAATGRETAIALGSLAKLTPPDGRRVVICRDDDPPDAPASRSLAEALERWRGQGLEPAVATPWPSPRGDRSDFNDVLRQAGPEAVRARIHSALLDAIGLAPADPPAELPAATLADAHAYVARIAAQFFTPRPEGELAPQVLLAGQGGIGKTDAAARFLPHGIVQAKAASKPHRAIVLVSEFKVLGPQLVERFRALGLDVALLRGRGDAFDPKPDDLCKNPAAVAETLRAKQDIRQSVCGTPNGPHCPFLADCEHVAAVERASRADVVVAAHNFIFNRLSKRVWHDVGFVLIDEDFTTHGDRIFSLTMETFTKPGLDRFPVRYEGHPAAAMTASLAKLHQALHQACEASQDGYLTAEVLRAAGMTPADCLEARRLEWRREVPVTMTPGMELERRRELARDAAINIQLPQIAAVWDAVHAILTDGENGAGRIEITTDDDRRGMRRELTVHTQHQVATWLTDLPVLMLNATASLGDVRRFFPRTVERRPPAVAAPHASARLIVGGFSNRTLKNSKSKREALKTWLALNARGRAETGLVTHKATLADLSGVPGMRVIRITLSNGLLIAEVDGLPHAHGRCTMARMRATTPCGRWTRWPWSTASGRRRWTWPNWQRPGPGRRSPTARGWKPWRRC
jgi:putative DNA primase/helicase